MTTAIVLCVLGFPLYLIIGYALGFVIVQENKNDTPTEKLSFWRRIKRQIIFPFNNFHWRKRMDFDNRGPLFDNCRDVGKFNEKKYCRAVSIIWPAKALWHLVGLIIVIFSVIFQGLEKVWELGESSLLNTITPRLRRIFRSALADSDFHGESIDRLKVFRDTEIRAREYELKILYNKRVEQLKSIDNLIADWTRFIEKIDNKKIDKIRFELTRDKLTETKTSLEEDLVKIEKAITTVSENEKELDIILEAIELYQKTRNLELAAKGNASLIKTQIEEMLQSANAAIAGCGEAYGIELGMMANLEIPVEVMAHQVVEGREKEKQLADKKLAIGDDCKKILGAAAKAARA